uniref:Uncharacterized protein n=1 Tax=Arundo donax TaxID=35708 RepID=A0A0A8YDI7_ARUDO
MSATKTTTKELDRYISLIYPRHSLSFLYIYAYN